MLNINKYKWQRVIYKQFEIANNKYTMFSTRYNQQYCKCINVGVRKLLLFVWRSFFHIKYIPIKQWSNEVHATKICIIYSTYTCKNGRQIFFISRVFWNLTIKCKYRIWFSRPIDCEWIFSSSMEVKQNGKWKKKNQQQQLYYIILLCFDPMFQIDAPYFMSFHYRNYFFDHWNWLK